MSKRNELSYGFAGIRLRVLCALIVAATLISSVAEAADRFWVAASEANWNDTNNWSAASGGGGGASVPGSADRAIFDNGGSGNGLLNVAVNVQGLRIASTYAGSVIQSTNTMTIGTNGFYQAGGVFAGGSATITISGVTSGTAFTLAGGAFTSTSARLTINTSGQLLGLGIFDYSDGTFTHNNGTVRFSYAQSVANDRTAAFLVGLPLVLNHLEYMGGNSSSSRWRGYELTLSGSGSVLVEGDFTMQGNLTSYGVIANGGTITVLGNITVGGRAVGGTTTLLVKGSGNQTYTSTGGRLPRLTVDKPAGTTFTPLDAPSLATYGFRLLSGEFTAPTGSFSLDELQDNLDIFTFTGGAYHHNNGTLQLAMIGTAVNVRTHTVKLQKPLILKNLTYAGGNTSTQHTYYQISTSGDGALLVLGDFTMAGTGGESLVASSGQIEVQGNVTIGAGATAGATTLRLTGTNEQFLTRTAGTAPAGSWTIAKDDGDVVLVSAFPISGATQDVAWNGGGINLSSNTFTIGRNLTIGAGVKTLGVTVADATTAGRLTVTGKASGITNVNLNVQVAAAKTDPEGQTYTILSNNTALGSEFKSETWNSPWKGTVAYTANSGKDVTLGEILYGTVGTMVLFR
jgi:hypothetical protein